MTNELAKIDLICADRRHLKIGLEVADGDGHLTVFDGKWGYCSAALEDEPHTWRVTSGLEFVQIRHADLERYVKG